jgi:hypothetical protein
MQLIARYLILTWIYKEMCILSEKSELRWGIQILGSK